MPSSRRVYFFVGEHVVEKDWSMVKVGMYM